MMNNEMLPKSEKKPSGSCWWQVIAFVLILAASFLYAGHANVTEYFYDSNLYWTLADVVFDNGGKPFVPVYILRFPESVRGYFFPVLAGFFKYLFHGVLGWRILASLSLAFCFSLSLPFALRGRRIGSLREMLRTLLAYAVFMWIWGDLMQYPLSDFISCFLLLSAIALLRSADGPFVRKVVWGIIAGGMLYAAYNTRSTYLYGGLIVLLAFILMNRRRPRAVLTVMAAALIGMSLTALPQCYINRHHEGVFSPKVYYDLVEQEVFKGLTTSRYETYVGDPEIYSAVRVAYSDPVGTGVLRGQGLNIDNFRLADFFTLFRKFPFDMFGICFRHLISLMTPVYRQAYITDIDAVEPFTILFSILLWLAAGYGVLVHIKKRGFSPAMLWILAVCVPGLLQIFDEPELRFFVPLYVLCYYFVFAVIDYRELGKALKPNWLPVLVFSLLIFGFWISLTGDVLVRAFNRPLLISDNSFFTIFSKK